MSSSESFPRPVRDRRLACLLTLVLLAASLVRAYGLGAQSLWHDEGLSVVVAQKSWAEILQGGGEYHPPFYHLLLGAWVHLAGTSEFAVRYLSLRLFDEQGVQRGQADSPLAGDMYPTSLWQPGVPVLGRHDLSLPLDLAPGQYDLRALVYRKGSPDKQWVPLGSIGVGRALRPATPAELGIAQPLGLRLGELELLSCSLSPGEATLEARVDLTLVWRVAAPSQRCAAAVWAACVGPACPCPPRWPAWRRATSSGSSIR